jgi:hypothetical protein
MRIFGHHFHHNDNPWDEAPPWAVELRQIGLITIENQEKQMSDLTKLTADIDALIAAATSLKPPPDNQAAVDALAAKVEAATAALTQAPAPAPEAPPAA